MNKYQYIQEKLGTYENRFVTIVSNNFISEDRYVYNMLGLKGLVFIDHAKKYYLSNDEEILLVYRNRSWIELEKEDFVPSIKDLRRDAKTNHNTELVLNIPEMDDVWFLSMEETRIVEIQMVLMNYETN